MKTSYLFTVILFVFLAHTTTTFAQEATEEPAFFTGISPIILERNAAEVSLMNNMSSFWLALRRYNPSLQVTQVSDRERYTRAENILRVTYGFSKKKNWDLGAEFKYSNARLDNAARSSPFRVYRAQNEVTEDFFTRDNSYHGLATIGLRLRGTPLKSVPELTLQATYYQPVAQTISDRYAFGADRVQTGLSATYFIKSGENMYYFFQADFATYLSSKQNNINFRSHYTDFVPSISTFAVINTWEDQWYIFPGLNYSTTLSSSFYRLSQQFFGTLGVFYQPKKTFSVLLNWQIPFILDSGTRNVEFVRNSYSGFTLGLRTLIEPR